MKDGSHGRGVRVDTASEFAACVRGELDGDVILSRIEPLWVAAAGLNLKGLPRFPGEPQTIVAAIEGYDTLAEWLRTAIGTTPTPDNDTSVSKPYPNRAAPPTPAKRAVIASQGAQQDQAGDSRRRPTNPTSHGQRDERPLEPTPEFCLIVPNKIRWIGGKNVEPRLFRLMALVMGADGQAIPFERIQEQVHNDKEVSDGTIRNEIYALNKHLLDLQFPWGIKPKKAHLTRRLDGP